MVWTLRFMAQMEPRGERGRRRWVAVVCAQSRGSSGPVCNVARPVQGWPISSAGKQPAGPVARCVTMLADPWMLSPMCSLTSHRSPVQGPAGAPACTHTPSTADGTRRSLTVAVPSHQLGRCIELKPGFAAAELTEPYVCACVWGSVPRCYKSRSCIQRRGRQGGAGGGAAGAPAWVLTLQRHNDSCPSVAPSF